MIRKLLAASLLAFVSLTAKAQFNYKFSDTVMTYVPLSGGTSVNGSVIWDEDEFITTTPFTWKMDTTTMTTFPLELWLPGVVDDPSSTTTLSGFMLGDVDIADRGLLNNTASLSPITYAVTGTAPNRIFKMQIANGGFWDEMNNYNTMNDSFNVQIWVYETSNIVEYHYGSSKISHPSDYFAFTGTGPITGYLKNVDGSGSSGNIYYLTGNPASPGIDTLVFPPTSLPSAPISSWPANGTVYRFTPRAACTLPANSTFTAGTASGNTVQFTYTGTTSGVDSVVWNFGDGQKLRVATNLGTPVTHTYTTAGHYSVTVTAYNSCGSKTSSTGDAAVAVKNIAALVNVHVYPSPASNVLNIEGLTAGSVASIYSVAGKLVLQTSVSSAKAQIDITSLPAGSYTLRLTMANGDSGAMQFVKE